MSTTNKKEGSPIGSKPKGDKLETQLPLSEKDEVKKAEERLNRKSYRNSAGEQNQK